jgi:hypothetical protein
MSVELEDDWPEGVDRDDENVCLECRANPYAEMYLDQADEYIKELRAEIERLNNLLRMRKPWIVYSGGNGD